MGLGLRPRTNVWNFIFALHTRQTETLWPTSFWVCSDRMSRANPEAERTDAGAVKHGAVWNIATGAIAVVSGLAPHVLHHAGVLIGVALFSGALGTTVFGVLGFAASIPFLLRLRRRFGTWRAPAIALAIFVAMFTLSAAVIGPAISASRTPPPPSQPTDHAGHHG